MNIRMITECELQGQSRSRCRRLLEISAKYLIIMTAALSQANRVFCFTEVSRVAQSV
jgi:hypothetical protein